jgi:type VI secretion system protein ImpA
VRCARTNNYDDGRACDKILDSRYHDVQKGRITGMDYGRSIDLNALLAPIPGTAPTGIDLRAPGANARYIALRDARQAARDAERKADELGKPVTVLLSEWRTLGKLTQEVLTKESKDLEVACWLTEALLRSAGFAGLRDGFELLRRLCRDCWDGLHSLRDEEGVTSFVFPLTALNGEEREGSLIQPIRRVPLTSGSSLDYAAYHYQQAVSLAQVTDKATREKRLASGIPTVEAFEQAVRASPREFMRKLLQELSAALSEFGALQQVLLEKCGNAAPPGSKIREVLEGIQDILRPYVGDLMAAQSAPSADGHDDAGAPAIAGANSATARASNGSTAPAQLGDREQALQMLAKAGLYFRQTEPHSPIGFALDDLIRRARLPLPELLAELLPDVNARRIFLTSAGIKPELPAPAPAQKT